MQEIELYICNSGLDSFLKSIFQEVSVQNDENMTVNIPCILTLQNEVQALLLISVQKRLKSLTNNKIQWILGILSSNYQYFTNKGIVQSIMMDCGYLLGIMDSFDCSSSFTTQDWNPQQTIHLFDNQEEFVLSQQITTTLSSQVESQSFSLPSILNTNLTSLLPFFSDESMKWTTDSNRVKHIQSCLDEMIQTINTEPSLCTQIHDLLPLLPECCFSLFYDILFSANNSLSCLQFIFHEYLLPVVVSPPSVLLSRELFTVLCRLIDIHSSYLIQTVFLPSLEETNCSKRTTEMIQRLFKASLPTSFLLDLSSQLLHQPLYVSNITIPIIQLMIGIDEKNELNMKDIINYLTKGVENKKEITNSLLLNLFRSILKKYKNELSPYKDIILVLLSKFDSSNPLTKLLIKLGNAL